jgi:tRNA G18 (ribose-2'-O)-methylase SpoU
VPPALIHIQSPDDPRVAELRQVRDSDLRREDHFLAEGEVVLPVLLGSRFATRSVLLSEAQARRRAEALPDGLTVYVAPQAVVEAIVGMPFHRGVLAVGARGAPLTPADVLPPGDGVALGLCGLTNHDNVGGIFRNAAAFGVRGVLHDRATCDPLYRKAIRVSVGGSLRVPFAQVADEAAVIDVLEEAGYEVLALSPRGELTVGGAAPTGLGRVALLLGAEGPGLSPQTLRRCRTVAIPMAPGWDSLNVAVASGIALAWLAQRKTL